MAKKNKVKKVNVRKERYAKFHKEKPSTLDLSMPDLSEEEMKQKREDELKIDKFLRFSKNRPLPTIKEKLAKSK